MSAKPAAKSRIEQEIVKPSPTEKVALDWSQKVDRLAVVRSRMKDLADEEQQLTGEIKQHMLLNNIPILKGLKHIATLTKRKAGEIPPQSLVERVGLEQALTAMKVVLKECRRFMGEDVINEIRGGEETTVLNVE